MAIPPSVSFQHPETAKWESWWRKIRVIFDFEFHLKEFTWGRYWVIYRRETSDTSVFFKLNFLSCFNLDFLSIRPASLKIGDSFHTNSKNVKKQLNKKM